MFAENRPNANPYFINNTPGKHNHGGGNRSCINNSRERMEDQLKCSTSDYHHSFTTYPSRIKGRRPLFHGRQNSKEGSRLFIPVSPFFYICGAAGQDITPRSMGSLQSKASTSILINIMAAQSKLIMQKSNLV